MNTQLLITFTKSYKLDEAIRNINNCYTLAFDKIYVLENGTDDKELI